MKPGTTLPAAWSAALSVVFSAVAALALLAGLVGATGGPAPVQAQAAPRTPPAASTAPVRTPGSLARPLPAASSAMPDPAEASTAPVRAARCTTAASGVASDACDGPALRLPSPSGRLPLWPLGQAYPRVPVVQGGKPPYRQELLRGEWPEGLEFDARTGTLYSTRPALHRRSEQFTLEFHDSAQPPQTVRQTFRLVRDTPPPPRPAAAAPRIVPDDDSVDLGKLRVYRLSATDIEQLAPPPLPDETAVTAPADPASAAAARGSPSSDDLFALLAPLQDIEFPTRTLFEAALRARQCEQFKDLQNVERSRLAAGAQRLSPVLGCQFASGGAPVLPAEASAAQRSRFEALLPPSLRPSIVDQARKLYPASDLATPAWTAVDDCRCVVPLERDVIEAFFPLWHARGPAPTVNFAAFHRINVLGVQFDPQGIPRPAPQWQERSTALARQAHRYDTRLHLVLQSADWAPLLAGSDEARKTAVDTLAHDTARLLDAEMPAADGLRPFLLPWQQDRFVFDGLTLFFDAAPSGVDSVAAQRFHPFLLATVRALVHELRQREGRSYVLNIVVPDDRMGLPGAYGWEELMGYIESADEKVLASAPVVADAIGLQALKSWMQRKFEPKAMAPRVTVRLLVLLREPTSNFKKALRARTDRSEDVRGARRVKLLDSIVPVIFQADAAVPLPPPPLQRTDPVAQPAAAASAPPPAPRSSLAAEQLRDDLAYYEWSYGGMAWWPIPDATTMPGQQSVDFLQKAYPALVEHVGNGPLCAWVCPNRQVVRLAFEVTMLLSLGLFLLVREVHAVRRQGLLVQILPLLLLSLGSLVGFALWTCDPGFRDFRELPVVLGTLMTALVAGTAWLAFRKRIPVP